MIFLAASMNSVAVVGGALTPALVSSASLVNSG